MKRITDIISGALLLISSVAFSQQETSFTQYRYHMNIINPAYAGIDNETILTSTLRDQWTGVPEAPITQAVSFGTAIFKNTGLGISFVNDKTFVEKQTFVAIDFSYKLQISSALDLYFGLKGAGIFTVLIHQDLRLTTFKVTLNWYLTIDSVLILVLDLS